MSNINLNDLKITKTLDYYILSDEDQKLFIDLLEKTLKNVAIKCELEDYEKSEIGIKSIIIKTSSSTSGRTNYVKYILKYVKNTIVFFENLYAKLIKILETVMEILPNIKTKDGYEKLGNVKMEESQKTALWSLCCYKWLENGDINWIGRATDVFIRFCESQFISNGNKRCSVLLTASLLQQFSIYLYQSFNKEDFIKKWDKIVHEIADKCEYKRKLLTDCENLLSKNGEIKFSKEELYDKVYNYI